jgi:hypothetical protein
MDMINEQDNAETADVILQTVFFEEIVFGPPGHSLVRVAQLIKSLVPSRDRTP